MIAVGRQAAFFVVQKPSAFTDQPDIGKLDRIARHGVQLLNFQDRVG